MESKRRGVDKLNRSESFICPGNCRSLASSTLRTPSRRNYSIAPTELSFQPMTDITGIRQVIERVYCGDITNTAKFVFNVMPYVQDGGTALREIFEKNLQNFREIVEDVVDQMIQDETDVTIHALNDIKDKFRGLSKATARRITKIKKRLHEISPDFDWRADGKDTKKLSKLLVTKPPEIRSEQSDPTEKLVHRVFMRGQWLKKELLRLQEENAKLGIYLNKFRSLAEERKEEELHVPRILEKEKKYLEKELNELRQIYKRNLSIIEQLYIDYRKCAIDPEINCTVLQQEHYD
ncbi:PREDICTED: uncharacterized protein LOC107071825 [Polistes dominula]|uniref:Uncharacterized protein LOC107071825 n=1 Tax=Polistes dominula TaxID=743375 RepID=A0ABM1J2E9_POLDO|nr:PREDICTED: uncharacterized protein LOC107071825 [Polistes dominula]